MSLGQLHATEMKPVRIRKTYNFYFLKILPGVVSSIADHGLIINIGFSQRKGFLPKDKNLDTGKYSWSLILILIYLLRTIQNWFSWIISNKRNISNKFSYCSFENSR